ncbi:serine hydrolase domain-containing protein [Flagellimonas flava]|uniref:serine hydrolase domain-containing protein n=1 Tax=Flagellimonas flava TaxID=570519 RepID=UPI003D6580F8
MILKGSSIIIFLTFHLFCSGQPIEKLERIKEEVVQVIENDNIPAISIGIVTNGKDVRFMNFGHFDRTQKQKVNEESIYQIASLGKTFIGIVAHHLLLENLIQLDDPITKYLPFEIPQRRLIKLKEIKIKDLLFHRSGFPQDAKAGYKRKDGEAYRYDYTVKDLESDVLKLRIKPGNKYQYSNFGYALLAFIMEQAAESSYEQLLSKYIIEPYHLESTALQLSREQKNDLVTPYRKDDRSVRTEPWVMGKLAPPSAIYSTTKDLSKLLIAQLSVYRKFTKNQKIVPLFLTQSKSEIGQNTGIYYGYGFVDWGMQTYGHSGDMDGYASDYSFNSKNNSGVVLLTSSGEKWIGPLIVKINKILME